MKLSQKMKYFKLCLYFNFNYSGRSLSFSFPPIWEINPMKTKPKKKKKATKNLTKEKDIITNMKQKPNAKKKKKKRERERKKKKEREKRSLYTISRYRGFTGFTLSVKKKKREKA